MEDPRELALELKHLKDTVASMNAKVEEVHRKILMTQWCPQPGLCVPLNESIRDHERRLRSLEAAMWKMAGAAGVCAAIVTLLGQYALRAFGG